MGILEKLRRKRSHPSQNADEATNEVPSPLNANAKEPQTAEVKKERKELRKPRTPIHSPPVSEAELLVDERDDTCVEVSLSKSEEKEGADADRDDSPCLIRDGSTQNTEQSTRASLDVTIHPLGANNDDDEFYSDHDNPILNESFEVSSIGEITEVSDDNMLRDDEGNPIDPDEAEENMLRDDEGNIIDPKTLVVRDFLLDLSCESDEYYDDSGEKINPKELISVIGEQSPPVVTDSSTQSEGEGDADCESELRVFALHEKSSLNINERLKEAPLSSRRDSEIYEDLETKNHKNTSSRRRRRRDRERKALSTSKDEYFHIMFNNKLRTLDEETGSKSHSDSGDEADDESPRSRRSRQRSKSNGSSDEKFIRARWEYSMQMMTCGSFRHSGDLVKDIMVPADSFNMEETGEI